MKQIVRLEKKILATIRSFVASNLDPIFLFIYIFMSKLHAVRLACKTKQWAAL